MHLGLIWGVILLIFGIGLLFSKMKHNDYGPTAHRIGFVAIILSAFIILFSFIRIVPAGCVGIIDLFGKVSDQQRMPGLNMVNPFARLQIMNIQTEELSEHMDVPSKEGLSIVVDTTILYRMLPEKASTIYKTIGLGYRDVIIISQFRSACRGVTVNYEAKGLYTSGREEISHKIFGELKDMLAERGIILKKVLLRSIKLPEMVGQAIQVKLRAEQESEQMKFILDKERQEAERKVIEAEGIAKAQEIINKTLTNAYLQHEAIQAQQKMAGSQNHTTVYIPSGDNGIPIVRVLDDERKR